MSTVDTVAKYRDLDDKLFMTVDEAVSLSEELARQVAESDIQVDKVIGVANGALLPATVVAERLSLPVEMVKIRRKGSKIKRRLSKIPLLRQLVTLLYSLPGFHTLLRWAMDRFNRLEDNTAPVEASDAKDIGILVIDDAIESGQTLKRIVEMQHSEHANARLYSAVISWSKAYKNSVEDSISPNFYITERIQHYPWSQNSPSLSDYHAWLEAHGLTEWD